MDGEDVSEVPSNVSILPDYVNLEMSYNGYRTLIIIMTVVLFIIMVIFIGIYYNRTQRAIFTKANLSKIKPIYKQNILPSIHSNNGEAAPGTDGAQPHVLNASSSTDKLTCLSAPQQRWSGVSCSCADPFWGASCDRESYSTDYKAIGNYTPGELNILESLKVNRKAFPYEPDTQPNQTTCEAACNANEKCLGYYYVNDGDNMGIGTATPTNTCLLLGKVPDYKGEPFDPNVDSTTYLSKARTKGRPLLPGSVIIYNGHLPNRFWLEKRVETTKLKMVNILTETLNSINFYPGGVIDDDKHIVVFSSTHFTREDARRYIKYYLDTGKMPGGVHVYIYGRSSLFPPFEWSAKRNPYWVMAVNYGQPLPPIPPTPPGPNTCTLSNIDRIERSVSDRTPTPEHSGYSGRMISPIKSIGTNVSISSHGIFRSPSMENFSISPLISGLDDSMTP